MARDTFEVYYNQNGRWQLHASYEVSQRDLAIEEARLVESKEGYATRVVRETFHDDSNTTEEVITWQSTKAKNINDADNMFGVAQPNRPAQKGAKKKQPPSRPAPTKPAPAVAPQSDAPKKSAPKAGTAKKPVKKKRKPKKKQRGVFVRLMMVLASSSAIAVGSAAGLLGLLFALIEMNVLDGRTNRLPLVVGTLVLVFFLSVFVNLQKQFAILSLLRAQPAQPKRPQVGPAQMMAAATKKPKPAQDVEFDQVDIQDLRDKVMAEDLAEDSAALDATLDAEDTPAELDADMGTTVSTAEQPAAPEPAPPPQAAPQHPPQQPAPQPQASPQQAAARTEEKKPPAQPKASPAENEARHAFQKFMTDVMRHVPRDINAFTRFGLNLYVAGAASVIGQAKRLARDTQLSVLKQGLQAAGLTGERADTFCVELPSHGKNPKYAGMIQAGVKAMQEHSRGNAGVAGQIGNVLQEWNLPEKRPAVPSIFTFVFTDIVGSTAMTQRLGNAGAQKAVRAHNNAVRSAIQAYKGHEVKHTGDGIMATFPDPPSAVAACIKMQREIAAHNMQNPSMEVNVRIGINAGEAVQEENDFFGAAVQMTARICDKATTGNIWVSQAVVDACKGQRIGFIPRGGFDMKGIQGSKRLFEVGWSDAHKNELADL